MKKIIDIETALQMFEEASIIQVQSSENGDYKTGNKNYDKIVNAVSFLKKNNSIDSISYYLDHKSIEVRLWAACYFLPIDEKKAINVLKEITKQQGIIATTAEITLTEWKKGNLKY